MPRTIEYCARNVSGDLRRRLRELETHEVVEKRCLQRCGACYRDPILVVDGAVRSGSSHDGLLSALPEADS